MLLLGAGLVARPPLQTRRPGRGVERPGRAGEMNHDRTPAWNAGNTNRHRQLHHDGSGPRLPLQRREQGASRYDPGNRVSRSLHCHLIDGKWDAKDWHDPYLNRKDCYKDASQPARNTAREVLAKVWTEYLAAHPQLSRQAEQAKAAHEVKQLESELADLESKAAAKRKELAAAKKRQASI